MNIHLHLTTLLLAGAMAPAMATGPSPQAAGARVVDCANRSLPRQHEIGALAGQANQGQAYATRQRLMAEIARACKHAGVAQVQLVPRARDARAVPRTDRYTAAEGLAR